VKIYRFGVFELNPDSAELRKRGIRIRLAEQPFRILCSLLDNQGRIVSRESLRAALWPRNTFVEFERGLNAAVAKLRRTLAESAENPRFIETHAGRGYRFLGMAEAHRPDGHADAESPGADVMMIGRVAELNRLSKLMDEAISGKGSMALAGGEPGIGKTHLIRAVLRQATRRNCLALVGTCYDTEGAPPYIPFVEMLEHCARNIPRESFRRAVGDSGAEIAGVMPELRRMFPNLPRPLEVPAEQRRRVLFNAFRDFLERLARDTPVLAVFEDLHWADESTLLLLQHLANTASAMPVLIIGTYRDSELNPGEPFARALAGWIQAKTSVRLSLRPLTASEVGAMLEGLCGLVPPPHFVNTVFQQTEGNPFFVGEVYRYLDQEGKLFGEEGAWRCDLGPEDLHVPPSVRLVLERRLQKLREESRQVLMAAAVVGSSFDVRVLQATNSLQREAVMYAIEEADRALRFRLTRRQAARR